MIKLLQMKLDGLMVDKTRHSLFSKHVIYKNKVQKTPL